MISFKAFLAERELPKMLSAEQFDALPEVSASNIAGKFKVGKVAFDNEYGLGATPNNQEVKYLGFAVELTPSQFLRLAHQADRSDDAKKFAGFINDRAPFASPTFYLANNLDKWEKGEPLRVQVRGHEGRGRMWAIRDVEGNVPIPVHVIPNGGVRARDLNTKFFDDLRETGIVYEGGSEHAPPLKLQMGRIFWDGKTL